MGHYGKHKRRKDGEDEDDGTLNVRERSIREGPISGPLIQIT